MADKKKSKSDYEFRPTLLVGLGGIGCQIASKVYEMASRSGMIERCRLAILGFDTDENDIRKMVAEDHMAGRNLICTSPQRTVWQVLMADQAQVGEWFVPIETLTTEIRQMFLHNGAGQIRMLSRLAFYAALKDPAIKRNLTRAVEALTRPSGTADQPPFSGLINVLLTGTLAGGTGSGMFLQTALYLNEILDRRGCQAAMRGLFLLPDVMVYAANLPANQIENVRANGYAALRELNGILLQTTQRSPVPVRFAYAPSANLKHDALPFKNITLIDYENEAGGHLDGGLNTYISNAARAAYGLLLTPIGGRTESVTVNDVRSQLEAAAQGLVNYYSSLGHAAMVYPTVEILDYLSLRYALRILSEEWLMLDRRFRDEFRRYEERRAAGSSAERAPEMAASFIRDLDQAVGEGKVFFMDIRSAVHRKTEDRRGQEIVEHRYETYLDALVSEMVRAFWASDRALKEIKDYEEVPEDGDFSEIAAVQNEVHNNESKLRKWKSAVQEALLSRPGEIFRNIYVFSETAKPSEWKPYHIQNYVLHDKVHPLEARYFLYSLLKLISERRGALMVKRGQEALERLSRRFDVENTDVLETPIDRISELMRKPRWKVWITRELSAFGRDYRRYFNETLSTLRRYAEEALKEALYDLLESQLRRLAGVMERFFEDLDRLFARLEKDAGDNVRLHGPGRGVSGGDVYVYATQQAKEELVVRLGSAFRSSAEAGGVNQALTNALYKRYKEERDADPWKPIPTFDAESLFRKEVVDGFCRAKLEKDHRASYSLTAAEAIRREARMSGQDESNFLESVVDMVSKQSEVLLRLVAAESGDSIAFWGISPKNASELGDVNKLFSRNTGTSPLVEENFPDDQLICFTARVNLTPSDLLKLVSENKNDPYGPRGGEYYLTYRKMVDAILQAERLNPQGVTGLFTPHLDKSWHVPGAFPELTPEETLAIQKKLLDSFVLALATGRFERATVRGKPVTYYLDWARIGSPDERKVLVRSHDELELLQRFFLDYPAIQGAVTCATEWRDTLLAADLRNRAASPENSALYAGLSAPETLLRAALCAYQGKQKGFEYASSAVDLLYTNLKDFLSVTMRKLSQPDVIDKAATAIQSQIEGLVKLAEYQALPEDVKQDIKRIAQGTFQRLSGVWEKEISGTKP